MENVKNSAAKIAAENFKAECLANVQKDAEMICERIRDLQELIGDLAEKSDCEIGDDALAVFKEVNRLKYKINDAVCLVAKLAR